MSEILITQTLKFVADLGPDDNPYQAMAHYIQHSFEPAYLPSGWIYLEHFIVVGFLIMSCQAFWVLLIRSKTKKFYHIGTNDLGLIQLDRANHCGLCYFLYGFIAFADILCEDLVAAGLLQPPWPSFIRGIKCTFTITCACVILWLSICYCLLTLATTIPKYLIWALNGFLLVMIFLSPIPILYSWFQSTMQYIRIQDVINPVIRHLLHSAFSYSPTTYSPVKLTKHLIPLMNSLKSFDLLTYYNYCGFVSYLAVCLFVVLIYIPCILTSFERTFRNSDLREAPRRQHRSVMINTVLEFLIMLLFIILTAYVLSIFSSGDAVHDPRFWLAIRIGMNGVICILGNLAIFIIRSTASHSHFINTEFSKSTFESTEFSGTTSAKEV